MENISGGTWRISVEGHVGYQWRDIQTISGGTWRISCPTDELNPGDFRLLDVDHCVVLPTQTDVRILVTSAGTVDRDSGGTWRLSVEGHVDCQWWDM